MDIESPDLFSSVPLLLDSMVLMTIQSIVVDMTLGNGRFKEEVEKLTGRRVTPRKRGRKPSQMG